MLLEIFPCAAKQLKWQVMHPYLLMTMTGGISDCFSSYFSFLFCFSLKILLMYSIGQIVLSCRWNPDAIVFTSSQMYGTPSYWMQHFFKESNGATLLSSSLQANPSNSLIASAITWRNSVDNNEYLRIKVWIFSCFGSSLFEG